MKLINTIYTPDSILLNKENYIPLQIGERKRFATCTSVCWLNDNLLALLNLYGNNIHLYAFNGLEYYLHQKIDNTNGALLSLSEHFCVSSDSKLMAVCSDIPMNSIERYSYINIYEVKNNQISPIPIMRLKEDSVVHNIRFTPDNKFLCFVKFSEQDSIRIFNIRNGTFENVCNKNKDSNYANLNVKAINFTKDGKFVILGYCTGAGSLDAVNSVIISYKFDSENGQIKEKLSECAGFFGCEDLILLNDDNMILTSDQNADKLIELYFNKTNGEISYRSSLQLQNLNFPHGMDISKNGKYLAVANYGGDYANIYKI